MVTDEQVRRLLTMSRKSMNKTLAAAKSGMDPKTARKYLRSGKLPSELKSRHTWRTREDPFETGWLWCQEQLELNPGLEAKTLFEALKRQHPGQYQDGQLRTLQRRVKAWRATSGPAKEVFFSQVHRPGKLCQSDFTHMTELGVTIQGRLFEHLVYHFVLTYSNWEACRVCFSESFESLSEGLQDALWKLGAVTVSHRTDRLSSAVCRVPGESGAGAVTFTPRYQGLMEHYGLHPEKIQAGKAHENGDVEQSHHRFKRAVDQALMLRGSRDFESRAAYESFLETVLEQLNASRVDRLGEELEVMRGLPSRRLEACKYLDRVRVDDSSLIHVERNVYSVDSRLIGEHVRVRLYVEHLEVWYGQKKVEEIARLKGRGKHRINYRHLIDWLVRKPGAFENYRYREDLFPTSRFRMAYDALRRECPSSASKAYLTILYVAARGSESAVDEALRELIDQDGAIELSAVEQRMNANQAMPMATEVTVDPVDPSAYDELLEHPFMELSDEPCDDNDSERETTVGGSFEAAMSADDASELRVVGPTGSAGECELRAVPVGVGGAGEREEDAEPNRTVVAAVRSAVGEEPGTVQAEAIAGQSPTAGADPGGRAIRGSQRERVGVWQSGQWQDAFAVRHRSVADPVVAGKEEGVFPVVHVAGAGAVESETGAEAEPAAEAFGGVRCAHHRRYWVRATGPRGNGGAVYATGRALRTGQRDADEQPSVLKMGTDLQGPDDDGGGDRPGGPPQRDLGVERAELPGGTGQEAAAGANCVGGASTQYPGGAGIDCVGRAGVERIGVAVVRRAVALAPGGLPGRASEHGSAAAAQKGRPHPDAVGVAAHAVGGLAPLRLAALASAAQGPQRQGITDHENREF